MELRFYIDPDTGLPHIYGHGVSEAEVHQIMAKPGGMDDPAEENSRKRLGQTDAGRYLVVIYVPDQGRNSAFVITTRPLIGKALKAYRRRRRRKPR